jgi:hypothetical protein
MAVSGPVDARTSVAAASGATAADSAIVVADRDRCTAASARDRAFVVVRISVAAVLTDLVDNSASIVVVRARCAADSVADLVHGQTAVADLTVVVISGLSAWAPAPASVSTARAVSAPPHSAAYPASVAAGFRDSVAASAQVPTDQDPAASAGDSAAALTAAVLRGAASGVSNIVCQKTTWPRRRRFISTAAGFSQFNNIILD